MRSVAETWEVIDRVTASLPAEPVDLAAAVGCTLAEPVRADRDAPAFDRVTVDGYAVPEGAGRGPFRVVGEVRPGQVVDRPPAAGEALRIFTGAALPPGGWAVVMQEDATVGVEGLRVADKPSGGTVRRRGEDYRAGAELIAAGRVLDPAAIALLAHVGVARPRVVRRPRVWHVTSGDEVVPPEATPGPAEIRDTNGPLVAALLAAWPVERLAGLHVPDDEARAWAALREAEEGAPDLWLFSGGASVGDYDFTPRLLDRFGFTPCLAGVRMRPGKPLLVATRGAQVAIALPGNPVSHFACFHLFVARVLARLLGRAPRELERAELAAPWTAGSSPRETFAPARIDWSAEGRRRVTPLTWNSSGHLAAILGADALIRLPANAPAPRPGDAVELLPCP